MQITENQNGIPNSQSIRESTRIIQKNGRGGNQQYFDNGLVEEVEGLHNSGFSSA